MRFFLKGLNPFKIQTSFRLDLFLEFKVKKQRDFDVGPKRKFDIFDVICQLAKFRNFWISRSNLFIFYNLESV
jgi:hypothetical protein